MLKRFIFFQVLFCLAFNLNGQNLSATSIADALSNKETVKSLNLKGQIGVKVPKSILEVVGLEELNLSNTDLKMLPAFLKKCKNLRKINLSYNADMDVNQVCDVLREMNLTHVSFEGCQLPFIPFQVAEIKSLTYLNVSNNLIRGLPDNFGKLIRLQDLNLSINHLDSIKAGLNTLPNLKRLNLSYNKRVIIEHLITSNLDFPKLEEINLNGVDQFPTTMNVRGKSLKKLDLSNTTFEDIYQLSKDSLKVEHVIAKDCKKLDYDFACKTLQNSGVKKLELSSEKITIMPKGIQKMKDLNELVLEDTKIKYVPSLNNHKKLERITVESNELTTLLSSVSKLDSLKYINIKKTDLSNEEVVKLVHHFPDAEVVYNPQKQGLPIEFQSYLTGLSFELPFANLAKKFDEFKWNSKEKKSIELESGTKVSLDENSFLTSDNKPYEGEVSFNVKEYKNSLDVYLSGLPMVYDSSKVYGFESGGMYEFQAFGENGEELKLNAGKNVKVNTSLPDDNGGFQAYQLVNNQWVNNRAFLFDSSALNNSLPVQDLKGESLLNGKYTSTLQMNKFGFEVWKDKETQSYRLKFVNSNVGIYRYLRPNPTEISFNPFSAFRADSWILIDSLGEEKINRLKKSNSVEKLNTFTPLSTVNPRYFFTAIQSIELVPNYKQDNFILTVVTTDETFQFEIIQDFSKVGPKSSKRKLKLQWKRYNKLQTKVAKHNRKVKMTYEEILKGLQEAGVEERDSMMSDSAFLAAKAGREEFMDGYEQLATTAVVNSGEFEFTEIGTACNIDRLRSQLIAQSKSYKIETYSNDSKDTLTLDHISVLSTQVPTSMKYVGDEVRIINKGKTILLGRTTDGEVAYMSVSKVKDLRLSQKQPIKLYMETISPVAISPGQLRSLITL